MKTHNILKHAYLPIGILMIFTGLVSADDCGPKYTEYEEYGTFGPSYSWEVSTPSGDWSGTWTLSGSGNPAWWKEDEDHNVVESKSASDCNTTWSGYIEDSDHEWRIEWSINTMGTLQFTLELHVGSGESVACKSQLYFGYSTKYKTYWDTFGVEEYFSYWF